MSSPKSRVEQPEGRRWATQREGAAYIGVAPRTFRGYIAQGLFPAYELGPRLVRVDLNEVDAAMAAKTVVR